MLRTTLKAVAQCRWDSQFWYQATEDSGKGSWTGASDFAIDESSGGTDVVVGHCRQLGSQSTGCRAGCCPGHCRHDRGQRQTTKSRGASDFDVDESSQGADDVVEY
jgi:hypothetical protein